METHESPVTKKTYDDISFNVIDVLTQDRKKLIKLIHENQWPIKAAAKKIGIKLCTAKYILYQYRNHGRIYQKKSEKLSRLQPETR